MRVAAKYENNPATEKDVVEVEEREDRLCEWIGQASSRFDARSSIQLPCTKGSQLVAS